MMVAIFLRDELLRGLASVPRVHRELMVLLLPHNFFSAIFSHLNLCWQRSLEENETGVLTELVGVSKMKKGANFVRIRKDHTHFKKHGLFCCIQK